MVFSTIILLSNRSAFSTSSCETLPAAPDASGLAILPPFSSIEPMDARSPPPFFSDTIAARAPRPSAAFAALAFASAVRSPRFVSSARP